MYDSDTTLRQDFELSIEKGERMRLFQAVLFLLLSSIPAISGPANIGVLSFDQLGGGINAFSILNLTGDPGLGGQALPPDFPVFTTLMLLNSDLTVFVGGNSQTIALGDIGPGSFSTPALQFADTTQFDSVTLNATLSSMDLVLADASLLTADSTMLSVVLLPSSGSFLSPGNDLAVITVSEGAGTAIPEPANPLMIGIVAAALIVLRRSSGQKESTAAQRM